MDDILEEVEIKIEYNESFEVDPLRDKYNNPSKSNMVIERTCYSDKSNELETSKINVQPGEQTFLYSNTDNTLVSYNSNNTEVTWYDSIDNTGRFLCKFCNLKYSTLQTIRFHVKSKHSEQANYIKENLIKYKRNSRFKCHICKATFKDIKVLKSHVLNNHSLADIKTSCLYCDATFTTENEMSEHLFIQHKKVIYKSTYTCNICGYRTSTKSHYNQHRNTHDGDKSKKCKYCDYSTNYLPNLKVHERIHTKDKMYVCDFINCKYRSSTKSALKSHQLKHNPVGNIFYCDKCSYKTIYRQSLIRHDDCHKRNSPRLKLN